MSVFDNVAARLKEFHPKRLSDDKEITAWREQAVALNTMRKELTNALNRIAILEGTVPAPTPTPAPTPEPTPPPVTRLAPRAYNLGLNDSDPRFCVFLPDGTLRPGIAKIAPDRYRDEGGHIYNGDGMGQDGGNWRDRNRIVPELKRADSMDGLPVCAQYTGPTGVVVGGSADYPAASYER
jgi:hypothetical protein